MSIIMLLTLIISCAVEGFENVQIAKICNAMCLQTQMCLLSDSI